MTDPLAVGTGDSVTFPDALMAGDSGLKCLVSEQVAVPAFLVPGGEHRRVVPSAPRQGTRYEPEDGMTSMDRYPLRERMISLRGSRLLVLGILLAPLVVAGYVGLTVVLFLPLLGLRRIFRRRSTPTVVRWDGDVPRYLGLRNQWDAATRRA